MVAGLSPDQVAQIESALEQAFEIVAGDNLIHVDAAGVQAPVTTIMYDTTTLVDRKERGLEIVAAGLQSHGVRELIFLKAWLEADNVSILPTSYFLIAGERWDLIEDAAIAEANVPLAGIQNLLIVQVRKATEINASQPAAGVIWGEPE